MAKTLRDQVAALPLDQRFALFQFLAKDPAVRALRAVDADLARARLHQRERIVKRKAAQAEYARLARRRRCNGSLSMAEFIEQGD